MAEYAVFIIIKKSEGLQKLSEAEKRERILKEKKSINDEFWKTLEGVAWDEMRRARGFTSDSLYEEVKSRLVEKGYQVILFRHIRAQKPSEAVVYAVNMAKSLIPKDYIFTTKVLPEFVNAYDPEPSTYSWSDYVILVTFLPVFLAIGIWGVVRCIG